MVTSITVDSASCTRCGTCVIECPTEALELLSDGPPSIRANFCIDCGHCGAVCKVGAICSSVGQFPRCQPSSIDANAAKAFLTERRSVRRYRSTTVTRETLDDVLSVGPYAPTASNAQDVTATVFSGERVHEFASLVNDYYAWLVRLVRRRALRPLLWFTGARAYIKNPQKLASVQKRVEGFSREKDWVFFGAPVVIVLSAPRRNRLFGRTNCVIAAERIMQYASSLGLGSCWVGFADVALQNRPHLARRIGLPEEHLPFAIFTLGVPAVSYHRLPARKPMFVTYRP